MKFLLKRKTSKRLKYLIHEDPCGYQSTGTRLFGLMGRHRTLQYAAAAASVVGVFGDNVDG